VVVVVVVPMEVPVKVLGPVAMLVEPVVLDSTMVVVVVLRGLEELEPETLPREVVVVDAVVGGLLVVGVTILVLVLVLVVGVDDPDADVELVDVVEVVGLPIVAGPDELDD
jgi:hypothetical protein